MITASTSSAPASPWYHTVLTAIAVFQQITGIMFPVFNVMSTVDPDLGMTPLNNGLPARGESALF